MPAVREGQLTQRQPKAIRLTASRDSSWRRPPGSARDDGMAIRPGQSRIQSPSLEGSHWNASGELAVRVRVLQRRFRAQPLAAPRLRV